MTTEAQTKMIIKDINNKMKKTDDKALKTKYSQLIKSLKNGHHD